MSARIDYRQLSPGAVRAMAALERFTLASGLDPALVELVRLRASYLTDVGHTGVPDTVYEQAREELSDSELIALTMVIIAING